MAMAGPPPRVRFAPSPTGSLHVGGARTALFNWLFARHHGGRLVLRFEDTDRARSTAASAAALVDVLHWLGIDWDEGPGAGGAFGPYSQMERLGLYRQEAARLEAEGRAYRCYCTAAELAARREEARLAGRPPRYDGRCAALGAAERAAREAEGRPAVLRLRVPAGGTTVVDDLICGPVSFSNEQFDDFVLMKSDGVPTYNFAAAIDDARMAITHVIRGDEHLSNTPKQLFVYAALGLQPPAFGHLPMILAPDRSKLSKRHGSVAVEEFREQGVLPEAILNYCALLGWSPGDEREVLTPQDLVAAFGLDRVSRSAAVYDTEKLRWLSGQHIRSLPAAEIAGRAAPWLQQAGLKAADADPEWLAAVLDLVRERVRTLAEIPAAIDFFFREPAGYDEAGSRKHFGPGAADRLRAAAARIEGAEPWDAETVEAAYRALAADLGVRAADIIHPTRLALTGRTVGPSLFAVMALLGRQECRRRLDRAADAAGRLSAPAG